MDDSEPDLERGALPTAQLPVLPVVITTLMSTDFNDTRAFNELLELVSVEPCLAIRLLQIDDAQGCIRRGETLPKALMHIGARGLEQLVTRQSVAQVFTPITDAEQALWLHSIQVAIFSRALADEFRKLRVDPDQAFLAGLLHDIGRFAHYEKVSQAPNEIDAKGWNSPEDLLKAEAAVFGTDHVQEGRDICQRLPLPDYIQATVFHHHSAIDGIRGPSDDTKKIIELVQLADIMSVFALRHGRARESELGDRCRDFVTRHSVYLKSLKPNSFTLQTLGVKGIKASAEAFLRLKLGPAPGAAN